MAKKALIVESDLDLEQKVIGLLACVAQEHKVEIERRIQQTPVSFPQLQLLHALAVAPGGRMTVGQLKDVMVDENPNVSRALGKLADLGLVEKERSPEDQRTVFVTITAEGERTHEQADAHLLGLSTGLSKKDLRQLYELLCKL